MMSSSSRNLEKYLIPLDEIKRATENFSCKIGGGGFGSVYKGQLPERWRNSTVAVKRLDADSRQGWREFRNEIELISKFQHENIIAFIGYCDEEGEMIIVYEYASNGSLDDHLRDPNKMSCLTWAQRLEICIGAARGLHYLHSGLGDQDRVIHRDVKSANILLDGNMVAKICDFGLSRVGPNHQQHTGLYTKVAGTNFYLDPSYRESGILHKESDVYSFGVVLFEVVSGMLVYHERSIGDERQSLINAVRRYHPMEAHKLIDPYIRGQINVRSFYSFDEIAYECLDMHLTERPTLDTVVKKLEEASNIQISKWYSDSIDASPCMIQGLVGLLNSVSPNDQRIASGEICFFTEKYYACGYEFAEAGAIPMLTYLLTSPDSTTQVYALTALFNISEDEDSLYIILESNPVPVLVQILKKGSTLARETAAAAIFNLSKFPEEEKAIGSAGAIPPLVLMLSEGTTTEKMDAVYLLSGICRLCQDYDNKGRAVTAGLVPILMDNLTDPQEWMQKESLSLLSSLLRHPEGKLAIGEAEAVPHLVELLGTRSNWYTEDRIVILLDELCSIDEKFLVEAQEHGLMGKLKDIITQQHQIDYGQVSARKLRRKIKDHQHVGYGSDASNTEDVGAADGIGMFQPDPTDSWLVAFAKRISSICDKFTV